MYLIMRPTLQRLIAATSYWSWLPLHRKAGMLQRAWHAEFMRWRPAHRWNEFAQWSLADWLRVIEMCA